MKQITRQPTGAMVDKLASASLDKLASAANARNAASMRALLNMSETARFPEKPLRFPNQLAHRCQPAAP